MKIDDAISAAMQGQNKNDNIVSWKLNRVSQQGEDFTVDQNFFTSTDNRIASGTIAEMPEGSSVTIQYTIEVNCVGEIIDSETVYSNEVTVSSDQTVEVQDEEHISVLPVAIDKKGTLGDDGETITWEIQVLAGEFESVSVQEVEFDDSLQDIEDEAEVKVFHGDSREETIQFIQLFGDGYTLKNDPKGALHKLIFQTTLKDGVSAQGVENGAKVLEPEAEAEGYVTIAQATLWKQVAYQGHDIGEDRIDWKTTLELKSDVDAVAFEDYIDTTAGANSELQHQLDLSSVKLTYAVDANAQGEDIKDITEQAKISTEDGRIKAVVKDAKAGRYILYCSTTYTRPMETDTKGTAELFNHAAYDIGDDGKRDGTTFAEQAVSLNYISKNSTGNDGGDITWTVHVNTILPVGFQNVTVTDTLPEGLAFDSATFKNQEIQPEVDGNTLTFTLTGANLNDDLVIETHVTNYDQLKGKKEFTNTA